MDITKAIDLMPPQSASIASLTAALANVRNTVTPVFKSGMTAFSEKNAKYVANREAIVPHLRPFLIEAGLTYGFTFLGMIGVFTVTHVETGEFQRSYFELQNESKTTTQISRKQDFEKTVTTEELDPQSPGKWNTYWQRHCLISAFTLWGTDDPNDNGAQIDPVDEGQLMVQDNIQTLIDMAAEAGVNVDDVAKQLNIRGDWMKATLGQGRRILSVLEDMIANKPPQRGRK